MAEYTYNWTDEDKQRFFNQYGFYPEQAQFDAHTLEGTPSSSQQQLRGHIGTRLGADDYFAVNRAIDNLRSSRETQVNALNVVTGGPGNFRLPSRGLSAASLKTMMNMGDEDIKNRMIHMAAQAGLKDQEQFNKWYETNHFDPHFYDDVSGAWETSNTARQKTVAHRITLRKDEEAQQYAEGDPFRKQALSEALQSIKQQPGNLGYVAGLDTDPAEALRALQNRLMILKTSETDIAKYISAFNSQQSLEKLNRDDKISDGLTKISNDIVDKMTGVDGISGTQALKEFGTRAKDYPISEKNAARGIIDNFISKVGEETKEARAKKKETYETEQRALNLAKLRRDDRTANLTDAQNNYALDLLMPISAAVIDGSMKYEEAAEAFMEQMRTNERGIRYGIKTTDRTALKGYIDLLNTMIATKKPSGELAPLVDVRTQTLWADLATKGTESDDAMYMNDLGRLNSLLRADITSFLSKIPGAEDISAESMGLMIAQRFIPTLQRIPVGERNAAFGLFLANYITGERERKGFINQVGAMGGSAALGEKVAIKPFKNKKAYDSWVANLKKQGFNKELVIAIGKAEGRIDENGDALIED